jgi:hypothetical protein
MAIINKGKTFANGEQLTADKLNQVIDNATFTTSAVDNVSTQLSSGAIIVKDGGVTTAKLNDGAVTTAKINDGAVTKAKIENVANMKVLGNTSGSAAAPQEVSILDENDMSSDSATALSTQQSIKAYVDSVTIGVNQTWQDMSSSRAANTSYQNTTGKPIMVAIRNSGLGAGKQALVSTDNFVGNSVILGSQGSQENSLYFFIVPNNHYYKYTGTFALWCELR